MDWMWQESEGDTWATVWGHFRRWRRQERSRAGGGESCLIWMGAGTQRRSLGDAQIPDPATVWLVVPFPEPASMGRGAGLERKLEASGLPPGAQLPRGPQRRLPSKKLLYGLCSNPDLWAQVLYLVGVFCWWWWLVSWFFG